MPWIILFPLSLTLLIETIIYMFLKWGDIKLFVVASVANIVLNTTMNLILLSITDATAYYIVLISYEIGTTLVEALIITLFMRFKFWKTLLFAVLANGVSYLVGLLLQPVTVNGGFTHLSGHRDILDSYILNRTTDKQICCDVD